MHTFTRNRSLWMALALALGMTALLIVGLGTTSVAASASAPTGGYLANSCKIVSKETTISGEVLTYTIVLYNSSSTTITADVLDELPEAVHYVPGSVTDGGVYNADLGKITWEGVEVPPKDGLATAAGGKHVALSFAVTATVEAPVKVINTAVISGAGDTYERSAYAWFVPDHPIYLLDGVKLASQEKLGPDEVLTYTVKLYNHSTTTITADVVDELPEEMNYVTGSVNGGGVYHADTRMITWENVEVPPSGNLFAAGRDNLCDVYLALSFAVTATVDERAEVLNTAVISTGGESFERKVKVLLQPESPAPSLNGVKIASQSTLAPDEVLTYTILLYNSSNTTITADVLDELPEKVNYVAGSVTGGGFYHADAGKVVWEDVEVPPAEGLTVAGGGDPSAAGHVALSFAVTATVEAPMEALNTALISANGESFVRKVWVLLIPDRPTPGYDLAGSRKTASQHMLAPEEVLTYTIWLYNSGTESIVANVTDPLPAELNYVAGSVSDGGVYDPDSRTLTWDEVTVPPNSRWAVRGVNAPDCEGIALTFAVTATVDEPIEVVNTAIISAGGAAFEREEWVKLVPERPDPCECPLDGAKTASQHMLAPDEVLTYTVVLYNSGSTTVTADVMDPLPQDVNYVAGSVSGGGVYDAGSDIIYWNGVIVPPKREWSGTGELPGHVKLTFAVTATVDKKAEVLNTAIISAGGKTFKRHVWVLLVPERPTPKPNLEGSFKRASRRKLPPGESLTYTIVLHNSGTSETVADVTDRLPEGVNYVLGSATPDAVYNADTRTLYWNNVEMPAGWEAHLSFVVTPSIVTARTIVTNTAVISADGETFERYAKVKLLPAPSNEDHKPPLVHSLAIGEQDVLDSPTVTLHISATDNVVVRWMYLREWEWVANPWPHWRIVQNSEWVLYQPEYVWTLGGENGTHFVGVWMADDAHNISKLAWRGLDFASLVQPGATVPEFGMTPYLVYYEVGVDVSAALTLTSASGYAAMDVWYTGNLFTPIATDTQSVNFTTATTGTYLFVVYGESGSTYDLSIEPGGGPRLPMFDKWGDGPHGSLSSQAVSGTADDLVSMLTESGLDPLGVTEAPSLLFQVYLPVVFK